VHQHCIFFWNPHKQHTRICPTVVHVHVLLIRCVSCLKNTTNESNFNIITIHKRVHTCRKWRWYTLFL
jgi:hypothetical protein